MNFNDAVYVCFAGDETYPPYYGPGRYVRPLYRLSAAQQYVEVDVAGTMLAVPRCCIKASVLASPPPCPRHGR
jgi:hypothetical protein